MKKTVLRLYNKDDKYSNLNSCYFLIMPDEYNPNDDSHYIDYLYPRLWQIGLMKWQDYNAYLEGVVDIEEEEMFWSEITNYELKECKINIDRVEILGKYKAPWVE